MKESITSSVVQTRQLASNVLLADITGEDEQFAYKNDITTAYLHTRLAVKGITEFSRGRKIIT